MLFERLRNISMVWLGLLLGVVLVLLDVITDVLLLGETGADVTPFSSPLSVLSSRWVTLVGCTLLGALFDRFRSRERRIAERIAQSENTLDYVFQNLPDAAILFDKSDRIVDVNKPALTLMRKPSTALRGLEFSSIFLRTDGTGEAQPGDAGWEPARSTASVNYRLADRDDESVYSVQRFPILFRNEVYQLSIVRDVTERDRLEAALREIAGGMTAISGESYFQQLAQYLSATLGMAYAYVGQLVSGDVDRMTMIAVCADGKILDNFTYDLADTPCAKVTKQGLSIYPKDVREQFPRDAMLAELQVESYVGVPLNSSGGRPIGILVLADRQPLRNANFARAIVELFASRTAAELERTVAEKSLVENERRFRRLIESMGEGAGIVDLKEVFIFANPAADEIFGMARGGLIGRSLLDHTAPDQLETLFSETRQRKHGVSSTYEFDIVRADGERRTLMVSAAPQYDHYGVLYGTFAVFRDITERKSMETALRDSEELLKAILESTDDGILVVDNRGKIIRANRRFHELWKMPPELLKEDDDKDLIEFVLSQLVDPDDFRKRIEGLYASPDAALDVLQFKDGRVFDRATFPLVISGQTVGRVWNFRDMTSRRAAERDLRRKQFSIDHSSDIVFWVDQTGHYVDVNQAAVDALGYSRRQLMEMSVSDIDRSLTPQGWAEIWGRSPLQRSRTADAVFRRADGSEMPVELTLDFLDFEGERLLCAFARDVSERRRTEQELWQNKFMIETASEAIFWIDREARLVQVNESTCRMLGRSRAELLGTEVWEWDRNYPRDKWSEHWEHTKSVRELTIETEHTRKDGSTYPVEVSINFIEFDGQELHCCFARDITERRRNELLQSVLYAISEATVQTASLEDLLDTLRGEMGRLIDTKNFYVALYNEATETYSFPYVRDEHEGPLGEDVPAEQMRRGLTDYVRRTARPFLLTEDERRRLFATGEVAPVGPPCKLWMGAPLAIGSRVIGVVVVQSYDDSVVYTERDKDLLTIVGGSMALAIQRKQAEESIRKLRVAVESSGEVIFMTDANGVFTYVNPEFTKLYGFTAEEVVGRATPRILKSGRMSEENYRDFWRSLKSGKIVRREMVNRTKSGDQVIAHLSANPIFDERGEISGFLAVERDITLQRIAQQELADAHRMIRTVLDTIPVRVFWKDRDSKYLGCNRLYALDAGFEQPEDIVGKTDFDMSWRAGAKGYRAADRRIMASGKSDLNYEETLVFPDGSTQWQLCSKIPLRDFDGNIVGVLGTYQDITERKEAVEKLQASEHRLSEAQRIAKIGSWEWDLTTNTIKGSDQFARIYGLEPREGEFSYDEIGALISPDDLKRVGEYVHAALSGNTNLDVEFRINLPNGMTRYVHSQARILYDDQGSAVRLIGTTQDVTQRHLAEVAVRESEARLQDAQRIANVGSWDFDVVQDVVNCSKQMLRIFGFDESLSVLPKDFMNHRVHPEDWPRVGAEVEAAITGGADFDSQFRIVLPDGTIRHIHGRGQCHRDESGRLVHLIGTSQDITDLKRSEEEIRESEARLSEAQSIANIGSWEYSRRTQRVHCSDQMLRIFGFDPAGGVSDFNKLFERVHPEDQASVKNAIEISLRTGEEYDVTHRLLLPDNVMRFVRSQGHVRDDGQGGPARLFGTTQDITEQKIAEDRLRESEARLAEAQAIAHVGSIVLDTSTWTFTASEEALRIHGLSPEQPVVSVETALQTVHPEDRERMAAIIQALPEERDNRANTYRVLLPDGSVRHVQSRGELRRVENGRTIVISTLQDITEQKKSEEERKLLEAQLRRTQRLETIGTLAGGIAHDFNNILTPILGYADMALISVEENHPIRYDLEKVITAAHRAKDLVQQILAFSRQGDQERRPLDMHLIVKEALELLRATLPATIEIRQKVDKKSGSVLADASQIHQVLMNLCTNAFYAMRDRGGVLEVELCVDDAYSEARNLPRNSHIRLSVRDTGTGIEKGVLERIFEPFFTTKPVGEGTGLGLSVVHGIVSSHGGEITAESEAGTGTVFHVYLPRVEGQSDTAAMAVGDLRGGNERLLLVDDEPEIVSVSRRMLEPLGYHITICTDSRQALRMLEMDPMAFDLVITDQTMPHLTGAELAVKLLALRPDLPILLMTGHSDVLTPEATRRLGIREFLTKPIMMRQLNGAVRKHLDNPQPKEA